MVEKTATKTKTVKKPKLELTEFERETFITETELQGFNNGYGSANAGRAIVVEQSPGFQNLSYTNYSGGELFRVFVPWTILIVYPQWRVMLNGARYTRWDGKTPIKAHYNPLGGCLEFASCGGGIRVPQPKEGDTPEAWAQAAVIGFWGSGMNAHYAAPNTSGHPWWRKIQGSYGDGGYRNWQNMTAEQVIKEMDLGTEHEMIGRPKNKVKSMRFCEF